MIRFCQYASYFSETGSASLTHFVWENIWAAPTIFTVISSPREYLFLHRKYFQSLLPCHKIDRSIFSCGCLNKRAHYIRRLSALLISCLFSAADDSLLPDFIIYEEDSSLRLHFATVFAWAQALCSPLPTTVVWLCRRTFLVAPGTSFAAGMTCTAFRTERAVS